MSKWYEVKIAVVTVYAVEVSDEQDKGVAQQAALDDLPASQDGEVIGCWLGNERDIDGIKRHADEVLSL